MRKKIFLLIVFIAIIMTPIMISYSDYQSTNVNNDYLEGFTNNLNTAINEKNHFAMTDITNFEWDRLYMFQPYTSRDEMEKIVGTEWNTNHSYTGYLMHKSSLGDYPLSDDSLHKLVFVNDDKVVLDITLDRYSVDFTASKGIIEPNESSYIVETTGDHSIIIRNLIAKN
ncbi:MAG: hypothetical protein ACE3L7_23365 [Candidatus Pristimantibacillus sp.]